MILDIYIEPTLVLLMIHINPNDQQIVLPSFHLQNKYYTIQHTLHGHVLKNILLVHVYIVLLKMSQLSKWQK